MEHPDAHRMRHLTTSQVNLISRKCIQAKSTAYCATPFSFLLPFLHRLTTSCHGPGLMSRRRSVLQLPRRSRVPGRRRRRCHGRQRRERQLPGHHLCRESGACQGRGGSWTIPRLDLADKTLVCLCPRLTAIVTSELWPCRQILLPPVGCVLFDVSSSSLRSSHASFCRARRRR